MFKRVLVAYDGSEGARAALVMGIEIAKRMGAELSAVSVEEPLPRYAATVGEVEEAKQDIDQHFKMLTKQARDLALLRGVELGTIVRQGHEVNTIVGVVREGKFDLLLIGYQGHSRIFERIIGSTALSVARVVPSSVLIARPGGAEGIPRILVGLDGSPLGRLAFRTALDLALLFGAPVIGVTVREVSPLAGSGEREGSYVQQVQRAAAEHARAAGVAFEPVVRSGHAARELCEQAQASGAALIILGATGLEHSWSSTIGGTATRIASDASCAVLLVRPPQAVLRARDVMIRGVSSVTPETPLAEVVEVLIRRNVKALPVVDARRRVVGIITGGDLLRHGDVDLRLSIQKELDTDTLRQRMVDLARSPKTAQDLMTRHVHTVQAETDLAAVIRLMAARRVKRLPVVDRQGELVGIVSRVDVLCALAALPEPGVEQERQAPALARTVGDAITTEVPVVPAAAVAGEVLQKLLESPLRRVVVVGEDGRVLGVISDRDLLRRSGPDTRPWLLRALTGRRAARPPGEAGEPLTATALMAPSLITVRPEDSLAHAIRLMMQHQVKRLVVVDEANRPRGLVDRRDVLRLLVGQALA